MKNIILFVCLVVGVCFSSPAQTINVESLDTAATELSIPKCSTITPFADKGFNNLRKITFNGIDHVPAFAFIGLPNLEEVIFNGDNLVIDGAQFFDLPKLKKVVLNGNTLIINGSTMVGRSPQFETFEINGLVTWSEMWDPDDAPLFKDYTGNFAMLFNHNSDKIKETDLSDAARNKDYVEAFKRQINRVTEIFEDSDKNLDLARMFMYVNPWIIKFSRAFDVDTTAYVSARNKARQNEYFWTKLEVLKNSPKYAPDSLSYTFSYAAPADSLLRLSRERFNLDSIAGKGDDISKIKNLTYWVHDNLPHDGSSYNPRGRWTLPELYDTCRLENRGVNCRMLAIALTEALLAEGIPARYLTCQSKMWDTDNDCHVICVAWSPSLNKWIWCDPTFAAFVTDENGLLLHPGEVRERLIADQPLFVNEDANWNHKSRCIKENYLDNYMAKNLYYITSNLNNMAAPEGLPGNQKKVYVTIAPTEHNFRGTQIITSDPEKFWMAPNK